ncbi:hypothetical protein L2E82_25149 [Cichorium intybus]|uniref:Uncharacterized protein n=1 Tax=Cichorium intybus TaxID=13427 RepID=A0ACB9E2E9_CICIN|nr:hypothetical protein L2E82_25149 [Cichorium intybus]
MKSVTNPTKKNRKSNTHTEFHACSGHCVSTSSSLHFIEIKEYGSNNLKIFLMEIRNIISLLLINVRL